MKNKLIELGCAGMVALTTFAPQIAYAESYSTTVKSLSEKGSDFLVTTGYGILILVGGIAFVIIAACVLGALGSPDSETVKRKRNIAIIVVVVCIIAGFLPQIINGITTLAGSGVNLGTVGSSTLG